MLNHLKYLILILFISQFIGCNSKKNVPRNLEMIYNPLSSSIHPEIRVYNVSDTSSLIVGKIKSDDTNIEGIHVRKIKNYVNMSKTVLARRLYTLERIGVVLIIRKGKSRYYAIKPEYIEKLGLKEGNRVKVTTGFGSVTVAWTPDKGLDEGIVFFPYGPWANQVYSAVTGSTGMPIMKGIPASIEVTEEKILSVEEIVEKLRKGV